MRFLFTHKTYNLISPFNFVFFPFPKQQMTGLHFAFWFSGATLLSVENRILLSCVGLDPPCLTPFVLLGSSSLPSAKGKADIAWPGLKSSFASSGGLVYCSRAHLTPKSHTAEAALAQQLLSPSATMEYVSGKGPQSRLGYSIPHFPEGSAQHTGLFRFSLGDETKISSPYPGLDAPPPKDKE